MKADPARWDGVGYTQAAIGWTPHCACQHLRLFYDSAYDGEWLPLHQLRLRIFLLCELSVKSIPNKIHSHPDPISADDHTASKTTTASLPVQPQLIRVSSLGISRWPSPLTSNGRTYPLPVI